MDNDQHVLTTFGNIENDDTVPDRSNSNFSLKSTWTSRSNEIDVIRQNEDFNAESNSNYNLHSHISSILYLAV